MQWVVFGEGKNDAYFIGECFRFERYDLYEREFNAEEHDHTDLIPQETEVVRRFLRLRRDDRAILLKSEEGPKLLPAVGTFVPELAGQGVHLGVVCDLDGAVIEETLDLLNQELTARTQAPLHIAPSSDPIDHGDVITMRCELNEEEEYLDSIGLIAFHDDLEAVVGIQETDDRPSREDKIDRYVEENPSVASHVVNSLL